LTIRTGEAIRMEHASTAAERNPRAVLLDFTLVCISITGEMLGARTAGLLRTMALAADATPRLRNRLALRILGSSCLAASVRAHLWTELEHYHCHPSHSRHQAGIGERQVCCDQRGSARSRS